MKTIKLTPVGLQTPEGEQRVAAAVTAFEHSHATVANAATHFLRNYSDYIRAAVERCGPDAVDDYQDLLATIEARSVAQDEFLRAIAGAPLREVTA